MRRAEWRAAATADVRHSDRSARLERGAGAPIAKSFLVLPAPILVLIPSLVSVALLSLLLPAPVLVLIRSLVPVLPLLVV